MGATTGSYIFKKLSKIEILQAIGEVKGLKILSEDIGKDGARGFNGFVSVVHKGRTRQIHVFVRYETEEYVHLFEDRKGLEEIIGYIPNYGQPQYVVQISLGSNDQAIEIISLILKQLGGVLDKDDCSTLPLTYINGISEKKVMYQNIRTVPTVVLNKFVRDYLTNNDITRINNQLQIKIKGMNLLKEYAIRNFRD